MLLLWIQLLFFLKTISSFSQYTWGMWSEWPMACSSSCKLGQRCRIRKCENAKGGIVKEDLCGLRDQSKECQNCVVKGICPIDAGWSEWFSWSKCQISESSTCGQGTRQRLRTCNNPRPKYEGMYCIGNSTDEEDCGISCADPSTHSGFLKESISKHFKELNHNVILLHQGDPAVLDCYTPAYLKASTSKKKLFVIWTFNGVPLRPLKELILADMKSLQGKMNKAGVKASFKVPKAHIQFTGSKLLIDSVTLTDSGVFSCILNYDYTDFINTFFVVIVLGKKEYARGFDEYTFNSNTDGLQNIEDYDQAEIRWYLNRQLFMTGLLANVEKRHYTTYVNKSMDGYWECHLFPDYHKTHHFIVSAFELKITFPRSVVEKLSDAPILHFVCYYFGLGIAITFIIFLSSFIVVKTRIRNWLNYERKEAIIEEEIANNRLLLIVARKRAMEKTIELMKDAGYTFDVQIHEPDQGYNDGDDE